MVCGESWQQGSDYFLPTKNISFCSGKSVHNYKNKFHVSSIKVKGTSQWFSS